jgi:Xaa-Pro aminopeptidase
MTIPVTSKEALRARRARLMELHAGPILLAAGRSVSRNFRANTYPFRASSHFLYLTGRTLEGAALLLADGQTTLFAQAPDPQDALWHGPRPTLEALGDELGFDRVLPLDQAAQTLKPLTAAAAALPTQDPAGCAWLSAHLGRELLPSSGTSLGQRDGALADAMVATRVVHDDAAIAQLRAAAKVSAEAHCAGMRATRPGADEHHTMAAMVEVLRRHRLEDAYGPIVTVHGEVLHCESYDNATHDGDLLLADVGGETPEGWAADITRTWPVSGRYSATQRAIYDVVLEAEKATIAATIVGARYRELHELAKRKLVEGLRALGIFRGDVDGLLERGAAAIFFPHGVGHLLGLDVHDMEDLGDRAGYASGRERSSRFGDAFLRLDRDLQAGMAVTIEPGFYQVPGILGDDRYTGAVGADLDRNELAKYADVRGIRIEDDVLITATGPEVLTAAVPKDGDAIEALMAE